jgi:hypothetical protein
MSNNDDKNYVSVGAWMGLMFVTAIPIVGWIMIIVWAFAGENESRKNFYRAKLAWILVLMALIISLIVVVGMLGYWAAIQNHFHDWAHKV